MIHHVISYLAIILFVNLITALHTACLEISLCSVTNGSWKSALLQGYPPPCVSRTRCLDLFLKIVKGRKELGIQQPTDHFPQERLPEMMKFSTKESKKAYLDQLAAKIVADSTVLASSFL